MHTSYDEYVNKHKNHTILFCGSVGSSHVKHAYALLSPEMHELFFGFFLYNPNQ